MKKRIRQQRMVPLRHVFVTAVVFFILFTLLCLWIINENVSPVLVEIGKAKTKQIATYAVNYGVGKQTTNEMEKYQSEEGSKQLIQLTLDDDHYITNVNYNMAAVTRIFSEVTQRIQQYLRAVEEGTINPVNTDFNDTKIEGGEKGVIAKVPLGQATKNVMFSNLGPTIPVKLAVTSNVKPDIKNQVTEVNINSAYIQIYLDVIVEVQIVLPFQTKQIKVHNTIPITAQYINGKVPNYYSTGKDNASIALPDKILNQSEFEKKKGTSDPTNSSTGAESDPDSQATSADKATTSTESNSEQ
ncbi:sporulation protein YunB [Pullulanibacillus pueri]|uniref:Sporulation protein YunB n=1 Tax=Pullulanibacillus pueri TaxID=1437324 RepID=A0A8J2ZSS4_9BACL|nr:sporulation protein YunB [Pullulanibacillus pueri]MBM7680420.1 sporulation protein YunB [Pullulanibacillus pueri]GGH75174.1 hypothetical protein GCM10007096_04120 [Pullulanibacillus pueri]